MMLSLGQDAENAHTAALISYDASALYRITVSNTGNTWLDNVVVTEELETCSALQRIDAADGDDILVPTERGCSNVRWIK